MMIAVWVVLGLLVAFFVVNQIYANQRQKKALEGGEIVKRPGNYESLAEIFTIHTMDPKMVVQAITSIDYSRMENVNMKYVPEKDCFLYEGTAKVGSTVLWKARLSNRGADDTGMSYIFQFISWRSNLRILGMNQLLTAIEKAFLSLDPQATVQTQAQNVKIN